jgi:hypothetical protein
MRGLSETFVMQERVKEGSDGTDDQWSVLSVRCCKNSLIKSIDRHQHQFTETAGDAQDN